MSEEEQPNTEDSASKPRRPDGTFMSKKELRDLKQEQEDAYAHLADNNKALMKGTSFTEAYFDGMNAREINKFLLNFHKQKEQASSNEEEQESEPNTPILGTPVGSGKVRYQLDEFLNMDPKAREIRFDAPASKVFGHQKNENEARNFWLDQH